MVARRVAAEGAAVVAAGRHTELGEHVVTEVRAGGGEALFVTCDATVVDDVAAVGLGVQLILSLGLLHT